VLWLDDVHAHPQVVANESLVERDHPVMGKLREPRPATRFSDTPAGAVRPAPTLGEHTDEVLRQAGVPEQEIADLRGKGVVG
jgi:formyl-CoA transferase